MSNKQLQRPLCVIQELLIQDVHLTAVPKGHLGIQDAKQTRQQQLSLSAIQVPEIQGEIMMAWCFS